MKARANPFRVKGPRRPVPTYVAPNIWRYRGWEVELVEVDTTLLTGKSDETWSFVARAKDRALIDRIHRQYKMTWMTQQEIISNVASDDAVAALALATYQIDLREYEDALWDQGRSKHIDFRAAYDAVRSAIIDQAIWTVVYGRMPTRAEVTRQLEQYRLGRMSWTDRDRHRAAHADAFYALPLSERIELVDDMLAIDEIHNAVVNPVQITIRTKLLNERTMFVEAILGGRTVANMQAHKAELTEMTRQCRAELEALEEKQRRSLTPWIVTSSYVAPNVRGKDVGSEVYAAGVVAVHALGGALVSHACERGGSRAWTSGQALRVWASKRLGNEFDVRGSEQTRCFVAAYRPQGNPIRTELMTW